MRVCAAQFLRSRASVVRELAAPPLAHGETETPPKRPRVSANDSGKATEGSIPVKEAARKAPRVWPTKALPAAATPLALHWHQRSAATSKGGRTGGEVEVTLGTTGLKQGMAPKDRPKAGSRICRAKQFARYASLISKGTRGSLRLVRVPRVIDRVGRARPSTCVSAQAWCARRT